MDFLDNLSISDFNKTSEPTADVWLVGLLGLEEAGPSAITLISLSLFFLNVDFTQASFVPQVGVGSLWF